MRILLMALFSSLFLNAVSAQAFISSHDQSKLLKAMNDGTFEQIHFEEIRCSSRSRLCIVKMAVGPQAIKAGCMIDRIQDTSDVMHEVVNSQGQSSLELSPYAASTVLSCINALVK